MTEIDPRVLQEIHDTVNHPPHYTSHPSGVECIDVVEHMGFNLGNAIKYIWRADEKGAALEDLHKAAWYLEREIQRRQQMPDPSDQRPPAPVRPALLPDPVIPSD